MSASPQAHVMYYDDDGWIIATGSIPRAYLDDRPNAIEGAGEELTHYVDVQSKTVYAKTAMPVTVHAEGIDNMPCACHCKISGPLFVEADLPGGDTALTFDAPGHYVIELTPADPQWLALTTTIEVAA